MTSSWLESVLPVAQGIAPLLASLVHLGCATGVTVHALLNKRQVHAAIGWIALAWLAPLMGALLYLMLGVNRIPRAAVALGLKDTWRHEGSSADVANETDAPCRPDLAGINRLTREVTGRSLLAGNEVTPLVQGDQAYPAMLAAIHEARHSVTLLSYIFNDDLAGRAFVDALALAQARGV
jgi:cardiolipin synthase